MDEGAPKLDLDFGSMGTKETSSGFSLGGWGGGWNTPKVWNLNGDEGTSTDVIDMKTSTGTNPTSADASESTIWSFGGNKKNKKKTTTSGFDFGDFSALDEAQEDEAKPKAEERTADGADDFGGFMSTSKKGGKKKKDAADEGSKDPDPKAFVSPLSENTDDAGESWNVWDSGKKEKKKGKNDVPPIPPPPPTAPVGPILENGWGSYSSWEEKKNAKKHSIEGTEDTTALVVVPEPEAEGTWDSFTTKKDKKKKGKKTNIEEHQTVEETPAVVVVVPEVGAEEDWEAFPNKKERKKGKKGTTGEVIKVEDAAIVAVPDPEPEADYGGWGPFSSKKDTKKDKKGTTRDVKADEPAAIVVAEQDDTGGDMWDTWGMTDKKGKKSKNGAIAETKGDPTMTVEPVATVDISSFATEDDWSNWNSGKKKDTKKKTGAKDTKTEDMSLPPPPVPPPVVDDVAKDDSWGTKKDRKGKKGKAAESESEPAVVVVPETLDENSREDGWAGGDWAAPSKKKKETEREKKKREAEEKREEVKRKKEEEKKQREEEEAKQQQQEKEEGENEAKQKAEEEEEKERRRLEEEKKKEKDSKKGGKKGMAGTTFGSKTKDLLAGSIAEPAGPAEDDSWGMWGTKSKDKMKGGKKAMEFEAPPPAPTPPAMGLTPEPQDIPAEDWGSFAPVSTKSKDKKGAKGAGLSRTTTKSTDTKDSKTADRPSRDRDVDLLSTLDDTLDTKVESEPKRESPKAETPAKAVRSIWGGFSGGASKTKTAKEKEKEKEKEEDEKARKEAEKDELINFLDEPIPPPPKSSFKSKADNKLARTDSKGSDKAGKDEKEKEKKQKGSELDALVDILEETPDTKNGDGWSFFGASKKTAVKKGDEVKKEIAKGELTNQKDSLRTGSKQPEDDDAEQATEHLKSTSKSKMSNAKSPFSTSKSSGGLSVAEKIKALEKEKLKKAEAYDTPPAPPVPQPKTDDPKKVSATSKLTKTNSASKTPTLSSIKKKELSPAAAKNAKDAQKASNDSVPGSFPSEGAYDDDILDVVESSPPNTKAIKKNAKAKKNSEMHDMIVEAPIAPGPPTPPPEPKLAKKERARVVRDEGAASSWGFWGATPKKPAAKDRKAKDDADVAPPAAKDKVPLARSKSTKTSKEKEEASRSSSSDKDKKTGSRPPKSRGTSFSALFGGPSPARRQSVRRSSTAAVPKSSSRRESVDGARLGMPSPPPDVPEMNDKAAKLMGVGGGKLGRKQSIKGKQKATGTIPEELSYEIPPDTDLPATAVPDPYAIDDDDMVVVNPVEDPIINAPMPTKGSSKDARKDKSSRTKSKKEVSPDYVYPREDDDFALPDRTKSSKETNGKSGKKPKYGADEDIVMVEAEASNDGPGLFSIPDDEGFGEKSRAPPLLKRSATTSKKSGGGLMGVFGGFRKNRRNSDTAERPKTKAEDDPSTRRKRTAPGGGDESKRRRKDERRPRRSEKTEADAEGFATDAVLNGGGSSEAEEAEARKEERRARRAEKEQAAKEARRAELREIEERKARRLLNDKAATEARKAKIREAREKRAREEEDREARRQDEKVTRRAAREGNPAEEEDDRVPRDLDPLPSKEHRSKHRSRDNGERTPSRPHRSDRRRSHMDRPSRHVDNDDRQERHSRRPHSSRRKSTAPAPVDDYFDQRNGSHAPVDPYPPQAGGEDHTSSWVNSQIMEPPPPPPIEGTVMEPPPVLGEVDGGSGSGDEERRKQAKRKSERRRSRYDGDDERRRRKGGSGEGSDEVARERTARPDPGRRTSWFQRVTKF